MTSERGRMVSNQILKGAWPGTWMGPRPGKICKVPHFVQNVGLLNVQAKVAQKIRNG
jgi:hypothetical protein